MRTSSFLCVDGRDGVAGSRERVRIALDETLRARTRAAISDLRLTAATARLPPPLVDSPKCAKCSLAGICLPDEVTFFRRGLAPRPLNPSADTARRAPCPAPPFERWRPSQSARGSFAGPQANLELL
jgi:hypothetical protein